MLMLLVGVGSLCGILGSGSGRTNYCCNIMGKQPVHDHHALQYCKRNCAVS